MPTLKEPRQDHTARQHHRQQAVMELTSVWLLSRARDQCR